VVSGSGPVDTQRSGPSRLDTTQEENK